LGLETILTPALSCCASTAETGHNPSALAIASANGGMPNLDLLRTTSAMKMDTPWLLFYLG
jgi:hypothetical protein